MSIWFTSSNQACLSKFDNTASKFCLTASALNFSSSVKVTSSLSLKVYSKPSSDISQLVAKHGSISPSLLIVTKDSNTIFWAAISPVYKCGLISIISLVEAYTISVFAASALELTSLPHPTAPIHSIALKANATTFLNLFTFIIIPPNIFADKISFLTIFL